MSTDSDGKELGVQMVISTRELQFHLFEVTHHLGAPFTTITHSQLHSRQFSTPLLPRNVHCLNVRLEWWTDEYVHFFPNSLLI